MSLRFRRSFKVFPGLRLNITKRGAGMTIGGPLARVSMNTNGRITKSVSMPGTGLYWQDSHKLQSADVQADPQGEPQPERTCPECGAAMKKSDDTCPSCGTFLGEEA